MDSYAGQGRLLTLGEEPLASVRYEYQIDRTNRVWHGTATRTDGGGPLPIPAGPALLETEAGRRAPVHYYHRPSLDTTLIVFTGRGAPPGE